MDTQSQSPFLRLPLEIRLMIYEQLLLPTTIPSSTHSSSVTNLLPDYHTYYSPDTNQDPYQLAVRTIDPYLGNHASKTWRRRSTYHVRTGPFLTSSTPTTYRILLSPYTAHLRQSVPSLLALNQQIHSEASKILYSTYTFSFQSNIEAAAPFLSDLTPRSRSNIRSIQITKKAGPYTKEFDRAEWAYLCRYLADKESGIQLHSLDLGVIAGRPGDAGWDDVAPIAASDFDMLRRMQKEWGAASASGGGGGFVGSMFGGMDLEWVDQLLKIRGLKRVGVKSIVEHCPPPRSESMRFWVAFSKSVEVGFREWLEGQMVVQ